MKTIRDFFTKHKTAIIVGIITFVITSCLQWLWNSIINGLPSAGYSIITAFENSIYKSAAKTTSLSPSITFLAWGMAILFFLFITLCSNLSSLARSEKQITKMQRSIKAVKELENNEPKNQKDKLEEIERILDNITKKPKKTKKWIVVLYLIFYLLTLLIFAINTIAPVVIYNEFTIATNQIKPYISDLDMDILHSQWTLMKNKNDYDVINAYIIKVQQDNKLVQ